MLIALLAVLSYGSDLDVRRESPAGSARMNGMGGAYRAIAEGAIAQTVNPAAIAVRSPSAPRDRWSGDGLAVAVGVIPLIRGFDPTDVRSTPLPTLDLQAGGVLGRRGHAAALTVGMRRLNDDESARRSTLYEVSGGWGLGSNDDRVHVGLLAGLTSLRTVLLGADEPEVSALIPTLSAGLRWSPHQIPLTVGLAARTPWRGRIDHPTIDAVSQAWEIGAGVATHRGVRSRGPRSQPRRAEGGDGDSSAPTADAEDARRDGDRFWLVSADLILHGAQSETTVLSDWTRARPRAESSPTTLAIALGGEVEIIPYYLRLRAGAYTLPGRLRSDRVRAHLTLGVDLAVIEIPRHQLRWTLLPTVDISRVGIQPGLGLATW